MPHKVVLTGSTGQLGSYILASLVRHPDVDHVWCLNRAADARGRQEQQLEARSLPTPLPAYVEFFQADFSAERLGLSSAAADDDPSANISPNGGVDGYASIVGSATHIVHCAWPVDWNRTFDSFEPSIRGIRHLIDLARASTHSPALFFLSSVAAVGNWNAVPGARDTVPEEEVDDWKVARFGYGQSKLVAERLLHEASRVHGLTTAVVRVGQVGGPVDHGARGQWPLHEWLPSMLTSSKYLGLIPRTLGPAEDLEWVPVDRLSEVLLELLFDRQQAGTTKYYHVRNPGVVGWSSLVPHVVDILNTNDVSGEKQHIKPINVVSWVEALEATEADANLESNPAVKLLPFFQNLKDRTIRSPHAKAVTMEVKGTLKQSPTLRGLEAVNERWISLWMQQWGFASPTIRHL